MFFFQVHDNSKLSQYAPRKSILRQLSSYNKKKTKTLFIQFWIRNTSYLINKAFMFFFQMWLKILPVLLINLLLKINLPVSEPIVLKGVIFSDHFLTKPNLFNFQRYEAEEKSKSSHLRSCNQQTLLIYRTIKTINCQWKLSVVMKIPFSLLLINWHNCTLQYSLATWAQCSYVGLYKALSAPQEGGVS